jgi:hypothetical protein
LLTGAKAFVLDVIVDKKESRFLETRFAVGKGTEITENHSLVAIKASRAAFTILKLVPRGVRLGSEINGVFLIVLVFVSIQHKNTALIHQISYRVSFLAFELFGRLLLLNFVIYCHNRVKCSGIV